MSDTRRRDRDEDERDEFRWKERSGWFRGARIETPAQKEARRRHQERKGRK